MAEELRKLVETYAFSAENREVRVTISIGASSLGEGMQAADLYRTADEKLYEAKRAGRNKVCH